MEKMEKIAHYDLISFPDIVQPYHLPMDSGTLRRSLSFEFPARDWTGSGFLMGKGIKMSVWKVVFKCSADIDKLKEQIASSKLDLEREEELVTELRNKCFIDTSLAKLDLEKLRADEMDELASRLALAEEKEIKSMTRLNESLRELLETRRALRSLEADIRTDVEEEEEGDEEEEEEEEEERFERGKVLDDESERGLNYERANKEAGEYGKEIMYESGTGQGGENGSEKGDRGDEEIGRESGSEREGVDRDNKVQMNAIADTDDANSESAADESQNEKRGGCFGFLRRIFCCCRRKRAKRSGRR